MENHEIIYLQTEEDGDLGRTWCQDRVHDDDVEYVRADLVRKVIATLLKVKRL